MEFGRFVLRIFSLLLICGASLFTIALLSGFLTTSTGLQRNPSSFSVDSPVKNGLSDSEHRQKSSCSEVQEKVVETFVQTRKNYTSCPGNSQIHFEENYTAFVHSVMKTLSQSHLIIGERPLHYILQNWDTFYHHSSSIVPKNGLVIEFGVYFGDTLRATSNVVLKGNKFRNFVMTAKQQANASMIIEPADNSNHSANGSTSGRSKGKSSALRKTSKRPPFTGHVAGFDSFAGLPEHWRGAFDAGAFDTSGAFRTRKTTCRSKKCHIDTVNSTLPPGTGLYVGWFQDTLAFVLRKFPHLPITLMHLDGDLFISATIPLQLSRSRIQPGSLLVFDELIGYQEFEKHEMLALYLWLGTLTEDARLCVIGSKSGTKGWPHQHDRRLSDWLDPLQQSVAFQVLSL